MLTLDAFDEALAEAYDKRSRTTSCEHAYRARNRVLEVLRRLPDPGGERRATRASRLALAPATLAQLELALDLLGIATPERM